jgi:NAD(P) transhydrogenase
MVVVGAGVIGIEYPPCSPRWAPRSRWSRSGSNMLEFCDPEIIEALKFPPARASR